MWMLRAIGCWLFDAIYLLSLGQNPFGRSRQALRAHFKGQA